VCRNHGMSTYGNTMLVSSWYERVTGGGSRSFRCLKRVCNCILMGCKTIARTMSAKVPLSGQPWAKPSHCGKLSK
jgi:hypothetical protein